MPQISERQESESKSQSRVEKSKENVSFKVEATWGEAEENPVVAEILHFDQSSAS